MSRGRGGGRGGRGGAGGGRGGFSGLQGEIQGSVHFPTAPVETYPTIELPVPRKITEEERSMLDCQTEIMRTLRASPFHITPPPPSKDIERYSDRYISTGKQHRAKLKTIPTDLAFFPDELHRILDPSRKGNVNRNIEVDLSAAFELIEQQDAQNKSDNEDEEANGEKKRGTNKEGGAAEEGEEEVEDIEFDDEDDDYDAQQYFEEGENDDDGPDNDLEDAMYS